MSDDELWNVLYDEYKKHGNSLDGAQLTILSDMLELIQRRFNNEEISDMLKNHFNFYHVLSNYIRQLERKRRHI